MATRPTLHIAVAKTKNTASDYNDNFDMMMDFIDNTLDECKDYVDDYMPPLSGQAGKILTNDGTDTLWEDFTQVRIVVETYKSGNDWYRIYDDNWCEQGGYGSGAIALLNEFADTTYTLIPANSTYSSKTATGFTLASTSGWVAMGYLANES